MLLRHSTIYFLARGVPGLINFLALMVFTRLLSPVAYGQYALVLAGVGLGNSLLFQWLRLGLVRFYPRYKDRKAELLSAVTAGYFGSVALSGLLGVVAVALWETSVGRAHLVLGLLVLWAQAWFELCLELARSQLEPRRYGVMTFAKSTLALCLGALLIAMGFEAEGVLAGLFVSLLVAAFIGGREWRVVATKWVNRELLANVVRYGLPLTLSLGLNMVVSSSDRVLIGWLDSVHATGLYAAGYELAHHSLGMLMFVLNLSAYPLALKALEEKGPEEARQQMERNVTLFLTLAIPATAGLALTAPNISPLLLGDGFQAEARELIPWIAISTFLFGLKAYYFDQSFQLAQNMTWPIVISGLSAGTNILFNILWIPEFGYMGAAYASVVAYLLGLVLSIIAGRKVFLLNIPWGEIARIIGATVVMAMVVQPLLSFRGLLALAGQVGAALLVYFACLLLFNVGGIRQNVRRVIVGSVNNGE